MKPFVVYVDGSADKVVLSKEDFEKYLKEVYKQGYDDGEDSGYNKGYSKGLASNSFDWWKYPQITNIRDTDKITLQGTIEPKHNPIEINFREPREYTNEKT